MHQRRQSSSTATAPMASTAPAAATTAPSTRGNAAQAESLGLGGDAVGAGGEGLLDALRGMPRLVSVVLDALPTDDALALAHALPDLDEAVAWLREAAGGALTGVDNVDAEGSIGSWAYDKIAGLLGFEAEPPGDASALAVDTASNFLNATGKLRALAQTARELGDAPAAEAMEGALASIGGGTEAFAKDLKDLADAGQRLDLMGEVWRTSLAVYEVDMRGPDASATFDAWFAATGALAGLLADRAGPWGSLVKPFAELWKLLGDNHFFTNMAKGFQMQGTGEGRANHGLMKEMEGEGWL